jgi:GNAT superfamily N-acetyltransferase
MIKLIDLLREEIINWRRASEFYDTGNYITINKNYGTIEFGLETLSDGEEALFINDISIKPELQGKGYGSKIIQSAIQYAKEQEIPVALRASVGGHYDTKSNISQEDLIKFYKKFGFELHPELSNFGHDDIFMVKYP